MAKFRLVIVILVVGLLTAFIMPVSLPPATAATAQQQANPPSLSANGPWLLYLATPPGDTLPYLWGINADGTGLSQLSELPVLNFAVNPQLQPDGSRLVAYVGSSTEDLRQDLALYFLSLPDGGVTPLTQLTSDETAIHDEEDPSAGVGSNAKGDIAAALGHTQGLAWSPDGQWLAFVGAMDGPSVDLYSYELATGAIRWLTNGPSNAYQLWWTANNNQIIHSAQECFLCAGGPYEGAQGIWGTAPDGAGLVTYEGPASARFIVWTDSTHLLMDSGPRNGGLGLMRILDIASSTIEPFDLGNFDTVAYDDSGRHALLYGYGNGDLLTEGPGLYLVDIDAGDASFIVDMYAPIWWDRYEQRFLIAGDLGYISVTPDGTVTADAYTTSQALSPDGRFSAWFDSAPREQWGGGLWLQTGEGELVEVMMGGGRALEWSPDSQSFSYDIGPQGLYLVLAETMKVIPLFNEPGLLQEWPYTELGWQAAWVSE